VKTSTTVQAVIEMNSLCKSYSMGSESLQVLKSLSLNVSRGEYLALMGPSGSGKSTLMNIIGCLDTFDAGTYLLNGHDVAGMNDNQLAEIRNREIGFIFQTFNLLPRYTALENVELPLIYAGVSASERRKRAIEVLGQVGLSDRMTHKPNELSGGQRQRVAVARALVNKPAILLADEPTGNLDSKTSDEIMLLFDAIHQQGNTILVVTHEEDIAQRAKRIIRLKDGIVEKDETNQPPTFTTKP
jgi:putative ABC transport system ATP-binding protein